VGVGAYFGIRTLDEKATFDRLCPTHQNCSPPARHPYDDAGTSAIVSDVTFGIGLASLAAGTIWWLMRRPHAPESGASANVVQDTERGLAASCRPRTCDLVFRW
jgi:hypothetical protein